MDNKDNFEILAKRLKDFAQEMGVTPVTLSAYENNLKRPSLDLILKVAKEYEISLDWLCGLTDKKVVLSKNSIETYADIIELITNINNYININYEPSTNKNEYGKITFLDSELNNFLTAWVKMEDLLNNDMIDFNLYSLWIYQQLEIYGAIKIPNKDNTKK